MQAFFEEDLGGAKKVNAKKVEKTLEKVLTREESMWYTL